MRKLSPPKALAHAIGSLRTYWRDALRVGMFWIPVLFVLRAIQLFTEPEPDPNVMAAPTAMDVISAALGIVAFSSIAVNWHRFILRDERGSPWRIDSLVLRYAGNSLLIMLMIGIPTLIAVFLATLAPPVQILMIPLVLGLGTVVTALSVKLPAVALGRTDFGFRDAWKATEGNHWQLLGVFVLNAAVMMGVILVIFLIVRLFAGVSPGAMNVALLFVDAASTLFVAVFNASVFTSLYGYFVERRDF